MGIAPLWVPFEVLTRDPKAVVVDFARQIGVDPATLNLSYSESRGHADGVPGLPTKGELRQRFIDASRRVRPFRELSPSPANRVEPGSTGAA